MMWIPRLLGRFNWSDRPCRWTTVVPTNNAIPVRALSYKSGPSYRRMISIVRASLFLIFFHQQTDSIDLIFGIFWIGKEFVDKQLFSNQNPLLVNNVVEFGILSIKHFLFVIFFLIILVFIIDIVLSLVGVDTLSSIFVIPILQAVIVVV